MSDGTAIDIDKRGRRKRDDGVRTIEDIKSRCRVDDETGCWIWSLCAHRNTPQLWLPGQQRVVSLTAAIQYVLHGTSATNARMLVPRCGNAMCGNPEHRAWGSRSALLKAVRPKLEPEHRAKIAASKRARSSKVTPQKARDVRAAVGTLQEIGERFGLHPSHAHRIRNGQIWAESLPASSVFTWGASC